MRTTLNLNDDLNTKEKVDYLTRIQCGFVQDTVYDERTKRVHWIPKRLDYQSCNQSASHAFIKLALEQHSNLAGIDDVDKYVAFLNELGEK